jgi:hypothetical protein
MAVLCDIKHLSQNPKYGYQCIKSKDKIAIWLDLSRATVFNAISALETKGFIERTEIGIKPSQFIYDLDSCQEEIGIYIKSNDVEMISKRVSQLLDGQSKIYTTTVQNLDGDSLKIRLGQSKIYTQDIHLVEQEKERKNNTPPSAEIGLDYMGLQAPIKTWLDYKKAKGQKYKDEKSLQALIKKLHRISGGNLAMANEIIEDAMASNYAGFYEPKKKFDTPGTFAEDAPKKKHPLENLSPREIQMHFDWYGPYEEYCQKYGIKILPREQD